MPQDNQSESSGISRATDVDWEELTADDEERTMMSEFSKNLRVLVDKALGQYENFKESELYKVYFKEDPVLAACFAVCLGIICVPVLTFVTFMLVVGLLTFLGFLFVEGTLIVITVIVAICIFHFVGIFVVSAGSCVYIFYRILVMLNLISFVRGHGGQGARSGATGTKQE